MTFIKNRSIKTIIFISYSLIIVAANILFAVHSYSSITSAVSVNINKTVFNGLNELNKVIDSSVIHIIDLSYFASKDDQLCLYTKEYPDLDEVGQLKTENRIIDVINGYFKYTSEVYNINVYLPNKKFVSANYFSVSSLEKFQSSDKFNKVKGLEQSLLELNYIDTPSAGISEPAAVITCVTVIKNKKEEILGYLSVDIHTKNMRASMIDQNVFSKNSHLYIINNRGEVVSSDNEIDIGNLLTVNNMDKILNSSAGGYYNTYQNNKKSMVIYSDTSRAGWKIVEVIPTDELYADFGKYLYENIFIAVCAVLVLLILSYFITYSMSKPIVNFTNIMRNFSIQSKKIDVTNKEYQEITLLYQGYNEMLDCIYNLLKENKEKEIQRRQSDIKVLQAQINPHFLYNTLNSISWNANLIKAFDLSKTIVMLSKLFRLSLNKGLSTCSLQEEIEHITLYMDIQKRCYKDSFNYNIQCEQSLYKYKMPKLILQPLIENSIIHGFKDLKVRGEIFVEFSKSDDKLIITVSDNGCGLSGAALDGILENNISKSGYGIRNINERIKYICGEEYSLNYSITEEGGLKAIVTLPIIEADSEFIAL